VSNQRLLRKPQRTCVVCGQRSDKGDLTRLVSTLCESVKIDPTGKMPGRGTYLCSNGKCTHGNMKKSRLEQALRIGLSDNDWFSFVSEIDKRATEPIKR